MTETIINPHPSERAKTALEPGYKLHWYQIKSVLGRGGFGITYLADDLNLEKQVAIKEYFPGDFAQRERGATVVPLSEETRATYQWGLERFVAEARTLSKFEHPNIVKVHAVFEENGTGYMVMSYESGHSLQSVLDAGQTLDEASLLAIVRPLLNGLALVHEHEFIHRDIKPDNIFIRTDGTPALLDFGSARQSMAGESADMTVLVTPGYAPVEQYFSKSDNQGPWTDIYGLGATLYRAVTGELLTNAVERSHSERSDATEVRQSVEHSAKLLERRDYSPQFLNAVDHAIKVDAADRPQSVAQWLQELPDPALLAASSAVEVTRTPSRKGGVLVGLAALAALATAGYWYFAPLVQDSGEPATEVVVAPPVMVSPPASITEPTPQAGPVLEVESTSELPAEADGADEAVGRREAELAAAQRASDLAVAQRLEQARLDLVAEQEAIARQRKLDEIAKAEAAAKAQARQRAAEAERQLNATIAKSSAIIASRSATVPDTLEYTESGTRVNLAELTDQRLTTTVRATANEWQDAGVELLRGRRYKIQASGAWKMAAICRQSDATGEGIYRRLCVDLNLEIIKRYSLSALIAKVGKQPLPFYVGTEFEFVANENAPLFLRSNDAAGYTGDNTGELAVTVELID